MKLPTTMLEALWAFVRIADEAREEWDKAPEGMRAGKILVALAGGCKGYRADIDAIHKIIADETAKAAAPDMLEALQNFCDPNRLREAVMMTHAHLSHHQACLIIEDDRLGIRAAIAKATATGAA